MIAKASVKNLRVTPRKLRQVIDLVRGKTVNESLAMLTYLNKGVADDIQKALWSAVNNAQQKGVTQDQLYVSCIQADQGRTMKRFRAAAFGRATRILKKTSHLKIELDVVSK